MEPLKFESRVGKINAPEKEVYYFLCDMRNFNRFIPEGTITKWEATADDCSFDLSPAGTVSLGIAEKEPCKTIKYSGEALNNSESYLWIQLKQLAERDTRVRITLQAQINPALKMIISKPIKDFLERLVSGLEEFDGWDSSS